jgi:hypothetical protein
MGEVELRGNRNVTQKFSTHPIFFNMMYFDEASEFLAIKIHITGPNEY